MEHVNIVDLINNIAPILGVVALPTCQDVLLNGYKLHKRKMIKPQLVIFDSPSVNINSRFIDIDNIRRGFHGDFVLECVKRLIEVIPKVNLNLFYCNINQLRVAHKEFKIFNLFSSNPRMGYYNSKTNSICVQEKDYYLVIPHELFHLASSYCDEVRKIIYSGFRQYCYETGVSFGRGLNEGYTQRLTNRYFSSSNSYQLEAHFAGMLEKIVGRVRMEEFYFNADIMGLINVLNKYEDEENVIKFISSFDYMNVFKNRSSTIRANVDFVVNFLIDCYIKRLKVLVENDEMEPLEMYSLYSEYLDQMGSTMKIRNKDYSYFNTDKLIVGLNKIGRVVKQKNKHTK